MTEISDADLRHNLSRYLDEAVETGTPIVVTREGGKGNVVLISEADFGGWQETLDGSVRRERLGRLSVFGRGSYGGPDGIGLLYRRCR